MPEQDREKIALPAEPVISKTAEGEYTQSFFGEPLVGLDPAELNGTLIVIEGLDFLRRDAESASHGSIGVLSILATVPPSDATVEQRPERTGHALRLLLEGPPLACAARKYAELRA